MRSHELCCREVRRAHETVRCKDGCVDRTHLRRRALFWSPGYSISGRKRRGGTYARIYMLRHKQENSRLAIKALVWLKHQVQLLKGIQILLGGQTYMGRVPLCAREVPFCANRFVRENGTDRFVREQLGPFCARNFSRTKRSSHFVNTFSGPRTKRYPIRQSALIFRTQP